MGVGISNVNFYKLASEYANSNQTRYYSNYNNSNPVSNPYRVQQAQVDTYVSQEGNTCTDGKDDGKIGLWEGTKSFVKGLVGGIPKAMINHPITTAVTVAAGAAAVAATGGAILPVLGAVGVATGVGMAGYGGYKAATAKTDGEAKQALETMGMGVTTTALSVASADKALEKAAEAGVKSAQVSEDAGILDKTVQMFKATPEALKVGKNQYMSSRLGVTYESYISEGGKVYKSSVEEIHKSANDAVNSIVDNANRSGRALNETDYARINHIRTQEKSLIEKLHLKAQGLDKDEAIRLIDSDYRKNASVRFGNNDVDVKTWDEYYGKPTCSVGSMGDAAKDYAKQFGLQGYDVNPNEVKLEVWSKHLNKVSHDNWYYQNEYNEKAYRLLRWYKSVSAEHIKFDNVGADRSRLMHYMEYGKRYSPEQRSSVLREFDQVIAAKKIELQTINSNNAKRGQL